MSLRREREIKQRSLGCFAVSLILHASAVAALILAPRFNILEDLAGAQESLGLGTGLSASTVDLAGDAGQASAGKDAKAEAQPSPQDLAASEASAETAAPPASSAPTTAAAAEPSAQPQPKPVLVAKADANEAARPSDRVSSPDAGREPAPAQPKASAKKTPKAAAAKATGAKSSLAKRAEEAKPSDLKASDSGEIEATLAAARAADTSGQKEQKLPEKSLLAPIRAKAEPAVESEDDLEAPGGGIKPSARPAAAPFPAPTAGKGAKKEVEGGRTGGAAVANAAPSSASAASSRKSESQMSGMAGTPSGVRDATNLREAPGNPEPTYPNEDRLNHREGTAVFLALVNKDGSLAQIRLEKSSSSPTLDQSAIAAFKTYRYLPGQQGWIRKTFAFSLSGEEEENPATLQE
jgi:TonB family protein